MTKPNPAVVQAIVNASKRTGADPVALLATSLQESGGRYNAVGDQGTSFGPFQYHQGGALGSRTPAWAMSNAEIQDEAQRFAANQIHGGKGAAALQRPADPSGYAAAVDAWKAQARQILAQHAGSAGGAGISTTPPGSTRLSPTTSVAPSTAGLQQAATQRTSLLQSIIDQNSQLAGIATTAVPMPRINSPQAPGKDLPLRSSPVAAKTKMTKQEASIVDLAKQYLGTPYKWGGTSPKTGFDCSGFAQFLYQQKGVSLPRTSQQQFKVGTPVATKQLQPGDLVFFKGTDGPANDVGHEGIYIGNGKFVHAPHTGDVIKVSNLGDDYYQAHYAGARRVS